MEDWVGSISDVFVAASAGAAALFAWKGVDAWKKQNIWKIDHDTAQRFLLALARFKLEVEAVRFAAIFPSDGKQLSEEEREKMTPEQVNFERVNSVYRERFEKLKVMDSDLRAVSLEAWSIWGGEVNELMAPVVGLKNELMREIGIYLTEINPDVPPRWREAYANMSDRNRNYVWDTGKDDDPFRLQFEPACDAVEKYLRKKAERVSS